MANWSGYLHKCAACGHWCEWVDDAWVCIRRGGCGSEWYPEPEEQE